MNGLIGLHIPPPLVAKKITINGTDYVECKAALLAPFHDRSQLSELTLTAEVHCLPMPQSTTREKQPVQQLT